MNFPSKLFIGEAFGHKRYWGSMMSFFFFFVLIQRNNPSTTLRARLPKNLAKNQALRLKNLNSTATRKFFFTSTCLIFLTQFLECQLNPFHSLMVRAASSREIVRTRDGAPA